MRVLIVNYGVSSNLGCKALLDGTLLLIRRAFPESNIRIMTFHRLEPSEPGVIVSPFAPRRGYEGTVIYLVLTFFKVTMGLILSRNDRLRQWFCRRFPREGILLNEYSSADIIVNTGGDLLTDEYGLYPLLVASIHLLIAILFGKPFVLFGETVGEFRNPVVQFLIGAMIVKARLVFVRESLSESYVKSLGVSRTRLFRIPDPSFALAFSDSVTKAVGIEKRDANDQHPLVCVFPSAIAWRHFPSAESNPQLVRENYLNLLIEIVRFFLSEVGASVLLVPHVTGPECIDDDTIVCREIAQAFPDATNVAVAAEVRSPREVYALLRGASFVVASRMHAALAGYACGVPTLSIGYGQKFRGAALDNASGFCHVDVSNKDLSRTETHDILTKVRECWNNRIIMAEVLERNKKNIEIGLNDATQILKSLLSNRDDSDISHMSAVWKSSMKCDERDPKDP